MSETVSLSSEELSISVFLLFCSVLLEITSRDESVFLYFCLLTRCQAREGVYSSQGGEEGWMCACNARTSKNNRRTTEIEVTFYCSLGLLDLQAQLEEVSFYSPCISYVHGEHAHNIVHINIVHINVHGQSYFTRFKNQVGNHIAHSAYSTVGQSYSLIAVNR